jgi:hypothetical protein
MWGLDHIETVLFYHPAVWWISRKLREERENCCDDIALEVMADRMVYVSALAQLEAGRAMPLALSASGGSLLQRIKRIVGTKDRKTSAWPLWVLIIGVLIAAFPLAKAQSNASTRFSSAAMAQNYLQLKDVNITYEALVTRELAPAYIENSKLQNVDLEPKWQDHIFFSSDRVGFVLEVSRSGTRPNVFRFSYDGTTYDIYDKQRDIMKASKTRPKLPIFLCNLNSLVLPAGLLAKNQNRFNQIDCEWQDVINPGFWSSMAGAVFSSETHSNAAEAPLNGIVNGKKITLTLSDKNTPFGIADIENYPGDYDYHDVVGFPANLKPLMDKPVIKYTLSEVGEATFTKNGLPTTFFYPKKATLQEFSEFTGDLLNTDTHEITKIIVNDPNFDESRFSQDTASASLIWDKDANKWITVPK